MKVFYVVLTLFSIISSFSQQRILVYHETNGFRHSGAISQGITMFEDLGNEANDWITDNSQNSSVFNDSNLEQYNAVVFLNTSGNDLLSNSEQQALESFIANGNGFIGIHAATDTYRDRSWDFYNELVGGIIQSNPNHTSNNFNADMQVLTSHSIVDFLGPVGSIWNKNEEYYYWQNNGGQLSTDNTILLEVEQTGNNTFDAARPITWFKESITYDDDDDNSTPRITINGIKSFYTALGHNGSDYPGNSNFRTMLKNATLWAMNSSTLSLKGNLISNFEIPQNPVFNTLRVNLGQNIIGPIEFELYDALGKEIIAKTITNFDNNNSFTLDVSTITNGLYIAQIKNERFKESFKVIKN